MRQGRLAGLIVAVCATAALAPSLALGGTAGETESLGKAKGMEYMHAKHDGVFTQAGAPANCDGDAEATGGGGSINGAAANAALNATYPLTAAGTGWQAEGSTTAGNPRKVTSYAICGGVDVDYVEQPSSLGTNTTLHTSVLCGSSQTPTGGGGAAAGSDILIIGNRAQLPPSTVGWAPIAHNRTASATSWESHAVCSDGYDVKYRSSQKAGLPPSDSGKAVARCKPGEAVLGGGFFSIRENAVGYRTYALATKPWDSKADQGKTPEDGWFARAFNLEAFRVKLVAQAVCMRGLLARR